MYVCIDNEVYPLTHKHITETQYPHHHGNSALLKVSAAHSPLTTSPTILVNNLDIKI